MDVGRLVLATSLIYFSAWLLAKPSAVLMLVIFQCWAGGTWQNTFLFGKKIVLGIYCLCLTQLHLTALKWNWKSEDGFPVTLQGSVWGSWQVTLSVSPSLWRQEKKPSSPARCPWCSPLWLTTLVTTQVSHGLWGGLGLFPLAVKQLCSRLQLSSSSPVLLCHSSWWQWRQISQAEDPVSRLCLDPTWAPACLVYTSDDGLYIGNPSPL